MGRKKRTISMSAMTLLRNPGEWATYKQQLDEAHGHRLGSVAWGIGPRQYPCLVATKIQEELRQATSCYVYLQDAAELAAAGGFNMIPMDSPMPQVSAGLPENTEFNKHISAMLMAIVDELVEVKVTTPERFEQVLTRHLANVDRWHEDDKRVALKESLKSHGGAQILGRLYPNGESEGP